MLPRIFACAATAFSGRGRCGGGSGLGCQDLGRDSDDADDDEDDVFHSTVFYDIVTGFACTYSNIDIAWYPMMVTIHRHAIIGRGLSPLS